MVSWKDLELNEASWWSHWAEVEWIGEKSYVMVSSVFDEYFFNRGGFVDCSEGLDAVARMEAKFEAAGRPACFSVQNECEELTASLNQRGYATFDEMSVMQLSQPQFKQATGLKVLRGPDVKTGDWADTFVLSFYGDLSLRDQVAKVAERLSREPSVVLLAGENNRETLGVLAAFRTSGLLGVYCVGTLGEQRGKGVAGSLIHVASNIASVEGRLLVLQTILSDGVEAFYERGGFRRLYLKHLMRRKTSGLNLSSGG